MPIIPPKVSIIIPVFNLESCLHKCLHSLVNQSLKEIEIICVNDGSTDNSLQIIEDFQRADERIIVLNVPHAGQGIARNEGLKKANGLFVGFVDGDDTVSEHMFGELFKAAADCDSEVAFCFVNCFRNGQLIKHPHFEKEKKLFRQMPAVVTFSENEIVPFLPQLAVVCWNKIYKRSFVESYKIGFAPYTYDEDIPFFLAAMLNASKISLVQQTFYNYNTGRPQASSQLERGHVPRMLNIFNISRQAIERKLSDCKVARAFGIIKIHALLLALKYAYSKPIYNATQRQDFFILCQKELKTIAPSAFKALDFDSAFQAYCIKHNLYFLFILRVRMLKSKKY